MEQIIHRIHQNKWSVIGPSIEHGNTHSIPGRATNLLTYGEWMGHSRAEERNFVSGYSSAWRCSSLRKLGNHLEKELAIPSRLQQRLKQSGERIYFAAEATMLHWEASYWRPIIWILFSQGKGMGYIRRGNSSLGSKIIGSLLAPLIAASRTVRGLRGLVAYRRWLHAGGPGYTWAGVDLDSRRACGLLELARSRGSAKRFQCGAKAPAIHRCNPRTDSLPHQLIVVAEK